ncbi:MAG: VOC family protein [Atopobiaceae bacterium]|jgi:hypothetical protein
MAEITNPYEAFDMHIAHIGINASTEEEASQIVDEFNALLGLTTFVPGPISLFSGTVVEVMKPGFGAGEKGHVGFHVNDVEAAAHWFDAHGRPMDWNHVAKNPDGSYKLVYFKQEIAGFALHITQD